MKQIILAIALTFLSSYSSFAAIAVHCEPSSSHSSTNPPLHGESATLDFTMQSHHQCNQVTPVLATECVNGQCHQHSFRTNECCYSERNGSYTAGVACGEGGQCSVFNLSRMTNGQWSGTYYYNVSRADRHEADIICTMTGF